MSSVEVLKGIEMIHNSNKIYDNFYAINYKWFEKEIGYDSYEKVYKK